MGIPGGVGNMDIQFRTETSSCFPCVCAKFLLYLNGNQQKATQNKSNLSSQNFVQKRNGLEDFSLELGVLEILFELMFVLWFPLQAALLLAQQDLSPACR